MSDKPTTEGGAKLMNHEGKMRSGKGLWPTRRATKSAITTGQKNTPMANCMTDHTSWPKLTPASGATTLPTTGMNNTGVMEGHMSAGGVPGAAAATGANQRPKTHHVATNCPTEPTHHRVSHSGVTPINTTPTVATNMVPTGAAATKAWRTGCLRSSIKDSG